MYRAHLVQIATPSLKGNSCRLAQVYRLILNSEVIVSGAFATRSPMGFGDSHGLLVFASAQPTSDPKNSWGG